MVVTDKAVDYAFRPQFEQVVLGKVITRSTELDEGVAEELLQCSTELQNFPTVIGNTMCTHDFYEGMNPRAWLWMQRERVSDSRSGHNTHSTVSLQVKAVWMALCAPSLPRRNWTT